VAKALEGEALKLYIGAKSFIHKIANRNEVAEYVAHYGSSKNEWGKAQTCFAYVGGGHTERSLAETLFSELKKNGMQLKCADKIADVGSTLDEWDIPEEDSEGFIEAFMNDGSGEIKVVNVGIGFQKYGPSRLLYVSSGTID
jgi:hypothetical protein